MKKVLLTLVLISIVCMKGFAQVPSYVPSNGLVGWWPFNGNANDESGNGNHGTVNGATLTTDRNGNVNQAFSFNGVQQNILLNNIISINNTFSLSYWVNIPANGGGSVVVQNKPIAPYYTLFQASNIQNINNTKSIASLYYTNSSNCLFGQGQQLWDTSNAFINQWHNYTFTIDGFGTCNLYIDGQITSSYNGTQFSMCNTNSGVTLRIGGEWVSNDPQWFLGKIDDIAIWNRTLTQQEVLNLYQGAQPCPTVAAIQGPTTVNVGNNVTLTDTTTNGQWFVSDTSVASIDTNGVLLGISPGNLIVYYVLNTPCGPDSSFYSVTVTSNSGNTCLPSYVPLNGLVGWWPFCGNANDESGNGHNGVINGSILAPDRFGVKNRAYFFNGINNFINTNLNRVVGNKLTISIWFYNCNANSIVGGDHPTLICSRKAFNQTTGIEFNNHPWLFSDLEYTNSARNAVTMVMPYDQTWHHIVMTYDGQVSNLFFDDSLYNSITTVNSGDIITSNLLIGLDSIQGNGNRFWNGLLDDVGVWNRVLNKSEISSLYTVSSPCTQMVSLYDTIHIYDTITTLVHTYDTIPVYDTIHIAVTDTLIINANLTAVNPPNNYNTVKVYPNPAKDYLIINFGTNWSSMSGYQITITNISGQQIYNGNVINQVINLSLNSWGSYSTYTLTIRDTQGNVKEVKKIVLQ